MKKKYRLQIVALKKPKGGWKTRCPEHGIQPLVSIINPKPREIGGMVCKKCQFSLTSVRGKEGV